MAETLFRGGRFPTCPLSVARIRVGLKPTPTAPGRDHLIRRLSARHPPSGGRPSDRHGADRGGEGVTRGRDDATVETGGAVGFGNGVLQQAPELWGTRRFG